MASRVEALLVDSEDEDIDSNTMNRGLGEPGSGAEIITVANRKAEEFDDLIGMLRSIDRWRLRRPATGALPLSAQPSEITPE